MLLLLLFNQYVPPLPSSLQYLSSCVNPSFLCPVLNVCIAVDMFTREALITSPSHSPPITDTPLSRVSFIHILSDPLCISVFSVCFLLCVHSFAYSNPVSHYFFSFCFSISMIAPSYSCPCHSSCVSFLFVCHSLCIDIFLVFMSLSLLHTNLFSSYVFLCLCIFLLFTLSLSRFWLLTLLFLKFLLAFWLFLFISSITLLSHLHCLHFLSLFHSFVNSFLFFTFSLSLSGQHISDDSS